MNATRPNNASNPNITDFKTDNTALTVSDLRLKLSSFKTNDNDISAQAASLTASISTANTNISTLQTKTTNITQSNNKTVITGNLDTNACDIGSFASNSIMGKNCGYSLNSGTSNCVYAMESGKSITSGSKNCIFGTWASNGITTSYYNSAFGYGADANNGSTAIGSQSYAINASTSIGVNAGINCTGSNNVYIGQNSGNSTVASNKVFLGDTSINGIYANVTSISSLSDARDKLNIQDLPFDALEYINMLQAKIYKLNPRKRYNHICDDGAGCSHTNMDNNDGTKADEHYSIGLISQNVEMIENELPIPNNLVLDKVDDETMAIKYSALIPILIDAIQTLTSRVEELENN